MRPPRALSSFPRALSSIALAAAMAVPMFSTRSVVAQAAAGAGGQPAGAAQPSGAGQPAGQPTRAAATAGDAVPPLPARTAPNPLDTAAENYWFFAKTAKYELASQAGEQALAAGAQPKEMLDAFEKVARARGDNLFETLYRWINVPPMRDTTQKLINALKQGQAGVYQDPKWISGQIERLIVNQRAYLMALEELRKMFPLPR